MSTSVATIAAVWTLIHQATNLRRILMFLMTTRATKMTMATKITSHHRSRGRGVTKPKMKLENRRRLIQRRRLNKLNQNQVRRQRRNRKINRKRQHDVNERLQRKRKNLTRRKTTARETHVSSGPRLKILDRIEETTLQS